MNTGRRKLLKWLGAGLILVLLAVLVMARLAGFGLAGGGAPPVGGNVPPAAAELLEGNWAGTWASNQREMSGELRCRVVKLDESAYQARFDAVFGKYFNHESNVTLRVIRKGRVWEFSGEQDLGTLGGGVYKYQGTSDGNEFSCTYDSAYDKGTFRMKRPVATTLPAAR